jgi:YD repeat-containing protein
MLIRNDNCQGAIGCSQYTTNVNPCTDADADNVVGQIFKWTNVEITTENYVNQQTQQTTYGNDGQSVQEVINYNYNLNQKNLLLPNSTSKVNSKGSTLQTLISYPQDYFSGVIGTTSDDVVNGLVYLINNNIVNVPIEQINTTNSGGNTYVTGGKLIVFNSNQPTVSKLYKLSLSNPVLLSSFVKSYINSNGTFVFDQHYELAGQFYYNAKGQVIEYLERTNGPHHSILWDYNSTDQIAQVANSVQGDIAYTSFEADGSGNWTIPSSTRNSTGASGLQSYNLSNGSLSKAGLSASNTYTISYWTQNSAPYTIAGTISGYPIKGVTNNGWTYYEHHVTGQTTITVSGSGNVDDVRLYPSNAQMTTYTYDPLIGMTSSTDAKGEVTYYEYDSFQRLQNIKDKDGNIIKSYVYHYQGQ